MLFRQVTHDDLGCASYLIGDEDAGIAAVTAATTRLLDELVTSAPPKDREVEAAKARARSAERYQMSVTS